MDARTIISTALKERGVPQVARASGVHFTRLYRFLRGSQLDADNVGRLRVVLVEVPDEVWLAFAAPLPDMTEAP